MTKLSKLDLEELVDKLEDLGNSEMLKYNSYEDRTIQDAIKIVYDMIDNY